MSITVVGLGPSGLGLTGSSQRSLLIDPLRIVVLRTLRHPAASELAELRSVVSCDDLYDSLDDFEAVYDAIIDRVMGHAESDDVVYAVPGSALVGEIVVPRLRQAAVERGVPFEVLPSMSFLDLVYEAVGLDPIASGLQVVDARDLPDPLPLHLPTVVTQVDSRLRAADVSVALGRTLDPDHRLTILDRLGDPDAIVRPMTVRDLATYDAGERTTVFIDKVSSGLLGLIATNRRLRLECPWDRKQTHHSLLVHLVEEAYETADAISSLPLAAPGGEPDYGAYAEVEEELGDLLLQVVFHATLAAEAGAFDIDEVAEAIRRKLIARHPHVFGDVDVADADEVLANWEQIKQDEKQRSSLMDDIPAGMSSIAKAMKVQKRASSVGFDWTDVDEVFPVLQVEVDELVEAASTAEQMHELGDVLFSAVNLARHLRIDPESALRSSVDRFADRFRRVERILEGQDLAVSSASAIQLEEAWNQAKSDSGDGPTKR